MSSEIWSEPTTEGLVSWWTFDEIIGDEVADNSGPYPAVMQGMNEGSKVFAHKGKGLYFSNNPAESLQTPAYKGITGNDPRTISIWVHTADQNATLLDFGGDGLGEAWTLSLLDGKVCMFFGGYLKAFSDVFVSDSLWHHIVVGFTEGASEVSGVFSFVDGKPIKLNPLIEVSDLNPEVWFDASDLNADGITDTDPSGNISSWLDKSIHQRNATSMGTPYLNSTGGPNNGRAIELRSGDYLPVDGTFFAKDYYFVFRSPPANPVWNFYGGPFGHNPDSGFNQRNSNYITQHNATYFHSNQYPAQVYKNGFELSGSFDLEVITNYMIVRLVVNDNDPGPYSSYQIGRVTGLQCDLDIAEIIAFENQLSDIDANLLENYLAMKWDLNDQLSVDHPSPSKVIINTVPEKNLSIGSGNSEETILEGTIDEVRIYNRSLTASEVSILYLGGSVKFSTSQDRQPPVVELYEARPNSNNSALLLGELTNIDQENPVVTLFYGTTDGGLSIDEWENNTTVNNGNPMPAGQFEVNIEGLTPGERYYFRAFA
ncbi:MAG: hypothetical protein VW907_09805, partial [Opitutae bacterium]